MKKSDINHQKPDLSLKDIHERFIMNFRLIPIIGIELEFYVQGGSSQLLMELLAQECQKEELAVDKITSEDGEEQFEVSFVPTFDLVRLASMVMRFKVLACDLAIQHNHVILFDASPYDEQPGCGMHVHVHLAEQDGKNVFIKQDSGDESSEMLYAIAGLLDTMKASMVYFAPDAKSYRRYHLQEKTFSGKRNIQTPKVVSWGGNNRSVALRIPESTMQEHTRRIEHRVPSASARADQVFAAILLGIGYGLTQQQKPNVEKSYGNATDDQYEPNWLPQSLEEALKQTHKVYGVVSPKS